MFAAYASLLGLTLIWGLTFPLVQITVGQVSPTLFLALRFAIASATLFFVFGKRVLPASSGDFWKGLVIGVFLWGGYLGQTIGLESTSAARSGFLTGTLVPLTPLFAFLLFGERFSLRQWVAVLIAFSGIFLMSRPSIGGLNLGDALTLAGAASFALQVVYINRWSEERSLLSLAWLQLMVSAVLSFGAAPLGTVRFGFSSIVIITLLITALLASALGIWVQMKYQPRLPAAVTAVIYAMEPVFAGLAAWLMLNEKPPMPTLIGAALILCGMILSSIKVEPRRNRL
jgi:drug/metabolite transporter (DMT)-like permease